MIKTQPSQKSFEEILIEASAVFEMAEGVHGLVDPFSRHRSFFEKISDHIFTDKLKIAVIGVIKSGKSTFVNSFLKKDIVKRGAGVVTSITTKIQKGKKNQALITLRSWDDINAGLGNICFSNPNDPSGKRILENFDIRRKNDREMLEQVYKNAINDLKPGKDRLHPEILSISHAFQGFDDLKDLVQSDETILCLESKEFETHQEYTGNPDKAFYIKDVCLSVPAKNLDSHIEIADCPGADSTDPSVLSKILTYLEFSNLMIYCINSRTGLRESDMKFLNQIKNFGLLNNIIFINNCDLSEHESLEDLLKIEAGIYKDLSFLGIKPELFSFSLLYNHFSNIKSKISKKDLSRFESWQKEKKMIQYCDQKTNDFYVFFKDRIEKDRHQLLISSHINRLIIFLRDLTFRTHIFLDLLSSDAKKEEKARKEISAFYQNSYRIKSIVADSLENSVQKLKNEINDNVRQMFYLDKESVLKDLHEYVQMLSIEFEPDELNNRGNAGFYEKLFLLFKEFHRRVDLYSLEAVTPLMKKFVYFQEDRIKSVFQALFESYNVNFIASDYSSDLNGAIRSDNQKKISADVADMDEIKKILGIQLPDRVFEVQYAQRIKTRVITGFGLKTISFFLSSLLNKQHGFSYTKILKIAAENIKTENRKIFKKQFDQYGNDLNAHYFLPLINAMKRDFREKTNERFKNFQDLNRKADRFFLLKHSEKEDQKTLVFSLQQRVEKLFDSIKSFTTGSDGKE